MPFRSTEHQPNRASPEHFSTFALASACNEDFRFQAAGWAETPATLEYLLLNKIFLSALTSLMPSGGRPALGAIIASVYGCRVKERGIPRRRSHS